MRRTRRTRRARVARRSAGLQPHSPGALPPPTSRAVMSDAFACARAATAATESAYLAALVVLMLVLAYLDVQHKDLFGTTHYTGTVIHFFLRLTGYLILVHLAGAPLGGDAVHLLVHVLSVIVQAVLAYATGLWLGLESRNGPPTNAECAAGLASSGLFVAAMLCAA